MLITEIAFLFLACICTCTYFGDTLYWIYKDLKEQEEDEKEEEEANEIKEHIRQTMYS